MYTLPIRSALCLLAFIARAVAAQEPRDDVPDPDFGVQGAARFDVPGTSSDIALHLIPVRDGFWVVGSSNIGPFGQSRPYVTLARLDSSGVPVASFGAGGVLLTSLIGMPYATPFLDSQLRLVVGIRRFGAGNSRVARFLPDGSLDTSFAQDGTWETDGVDDTSEFVHDVAPAPFDGVYVSKQREPVFQNSEIIRLDATGAVDASFAPFGSQQMAPYIPFGAAKLRRDEQGRIWWAASAGVLATQVMTDALVRLDDAGQLDPSWSDDGISIAPFACESGGAARAHLGLLPGGGAVVLADVPNIDRTSLLAYGPNGTPMAARCDGPQDPLRHSDSIAVRDDASFYVAGQYCREFQHCGATIRRLRVQNGAFVEDPAFRVTDAAVFFDDVLGRSNGTGWAVVIDGGMPVLAGSTGNIDGADEGDSLIVRYGGSNQLFDSGFE